VDLRHLCFALRRHRACEGLRRRALVVCGFGRRATGYEAKGSGRAHRDRSHRVPMQIESHRPPRVPSLRGSQEEAYVQRMPMCASVGFMDFTGPRAQKEWIRCAPPGTATAQLVLFTSIQSRRERRPAGSASCRAASSLGARPPNALDEEARAAPLGLVPVERDVHCRALRAPVVRRRPGDE
jgi:hypothetical protein